MTPLSFAVLRRLADGEFHSGEALARELEVSRASVWHAVNAAVATGVPLQRVHGRGYRSPQPLELLDAPAINAALAARGIPVVAAVVDTIDSTNTALLRDSATGNIHGRLLAAEWQTAGRGRLGRKWTGVVGGSLMFSLGWRFECGATALAGLSLVVGLALANALAELGVPDVQLKWPNDLVWRGQKLGGVLIELAGDALGPSTAVIGVGLNFRLPAAARGDIAQPVVDLAGIVTAPPERGLVLARLAAQLADTLGRFANEGFAPFRADWERLHAYAGATVVAKLPSGSEIVGVATGVADDGALLLERNGRAERLISGEISVRLSS